MIKRVVIILLCVAGMLSLVSCDVSLGGDGVTHPVTVTNGTGGILSSLKIGDTLFNEEIAAGDTRVVNYVYVPTQIEVTYTGKQVNEYGEVLNGSVTLTPDGTASETSYSIAPDEYVAVWIHQYSNGNVIDLIGIGDSSGSISGLGDLTSYADYGGVSNEAIVFTDTSTTVTGTLANTNISNLNIYATVTGEKLTGEVADEGIANGGGTLVNNIDSQCQIMKNSFVLKNGDTVLATDNGDGGLDSVNNGLDTGSTNSIDYSSGAVVFTLDASVTPTDLKVCYRYVKWGKTLSRIPVADSLSVKLGTAAIAIDTVYAGDTSLGIITGDPLMGSNSNVNYSTGEMTLKFFESYIDADTIGDADITVQYDYLIGSADSGGNISGVSIAGGGTLDNNTGNYSFDFQNIDGEHTVISVYCAYHFPYAMNIPANIDGSTTPLAEAESLELDEATGIVEDYTAHKFIEEGSVAITVALGSGATPGDYAVTDGDSNGSLEVEDIDGLGVAEVGTIDYISGKIKFALTQDLIDAGYVITQASVTTYNYYAAGESTRVWAGFFKKTALDGNGIYVLSMSNPTTVVDYYGFTDFYFLYDVNEYGGTSLDLVCGEHP